MLDSRALSNPELDVLGGWSAERRLAVSLRSLPTGDRSSSEGSSVKAKGIADGDSTVGKSPGPTLFLRGVGSEAFLLGILDGVGVLEREGLSLESG
jgi:hypothetical protein